MNKICPLLAYAFVFRSCGDFMIDLMRESLQRVAK